MDNTPEKFDRNILAGFIVVTQYIHSIYTVTLASATMSILASRRIVPVSYTVTLPVKTLHLTSLSARSLGEGSEEQESPCHCALFRTSLHQRSDLLSERSSGGEEGRGRSRGEKNAS